MVSGRNSCASTFNACRTVDNDHTPNVADDAVDAPNNERQEGSRKLETYKKLLNVLFLFSKHICVYNDSRRV